MALEPGEVAQVDVQINKALEPRVLQDQPRSTNTTERILALAEAQADNRSKPAH